MMSLIQDLKKHFGPWEKERCWTIQEQLPIPVLVLKEPRIYRLKVGPGLMRYATFESLSMQHRYQDIGVSGSSYDYETGEVTFLGASERDVEEWFRRYSDIVIRG